MEQYCIIQSSISLLAEVKGSSSESPNKGRHEGDNKNVPFIFKACQLGVYVDQVACIDLCLDEYHYVAYTKHYKQLYRNNGSLICLLTFK